MKPTIGRIVHYHDVDNGGPAPMAAIVTFVHSDNMVNLAAFGHDGELQQRTSVHLVQPEDEMQVPNFSHATWPPRV